MPVINVEDLTDKDKALMEVNQLKNEVKLERWLVSRSARFQVNCGSLRRSSNAEITIIVA